MKVMPLLRDVQIGADAAENDRDLNHYFVRTSAFWEVVTDESDLILGPKGSGKSAISRQLASADVVIPGLEDVDVIPAFNLEGSVLFRRLASDLSEASEADLRLAWMAYCLSLAGNHLIATYGDVVDCSGIASVLASADTLHAENMPRSVWGKVVAATRRLLPSRVEAGASLNETGLPAIEGAVDFAGPSSDEPAATPIREIDWESLLEAVVDTFRQLDRRCWIVFDRLDEAFPEHRTLERKALRALLRAHIDICSYGERLRTKLFLRTDLFDRITIAEGFVNATHLRTQRIRWDRDSIVDLVAKRVFESELLRRTFDIPPESLRAQEGRLKICLILLPKSGESQPIFDWIISRTADASAEPNPRNVITLLRVARSAQLQVCDRDDTDFDTQHSLIGTRSLFDASKQLSSTRLEDTIFAEFNHLRPALERLKGKFTTYAASELAEVLKLEQASEEFQKILSDLKYSGVMRQSSSGVLAIPLLYRHALGVQERGRPRSNAERRRPRKGRREAPPSELPGADVQTPDDATG